MNIDSLRDYAVLDGERLQDLWRDRDNLSAGCIEFVRMQHELCQLLSVDADTDSIDLHVRIRLGIRRLLRDTHILAGRLAAQPIEVEPGMCPYPVNGTKTARECVAAGACGCNERNAPQPSGEHQ